MPTITRDLRGLGPVYSKVTYFADSVVDFRGIPYATVSHRFRRAEPLEKWSPDNDTLSTDGFNASHYGY